jgi:CheY-like chemotaxis protein
MLVEDRQDDVILIRRAFLQARVFNPVVVVRDGEEAIAYLSGQGVYANRSLHPLPDFILLDLKMPKVDGFEVLTWIRAHPILRGLPVVVLTSSTELKDVNRAYELGANSFLVKPMDFETFTALGGLLERYWLKANAHAEHKTPGAEPESALDLNGRTSKAS